MVRVQGLGRRCRRWCPGPDTTRQAGQQGSRAAGCWRGACSKQAGAGGEGQGQGCSLGASRHLPTWAGGPMKGGGVLGRAPLRLPSPDDHWHWQAARLTHGRAVPKSAPTNPGRPVQETLLRGALLCTYVSICPSPLHRFTRSAQQAARPIGYLGPQPRPRPRPNAACPRPARCPAQSQAQSQSQSHSQSQAALTSSSRSLRCATSSTSSIQRHMVPAWMKPPVLRAGRAGQGRKHTGQQRAGRGGAGRVFCGLQPAACGCWRCPCRACRP